MSTTPVMSADASEGQPYRLETMTVAELYAAKLGKKQYCVEGFLPMRGSSMLAGKPKCGKSTLVRQLIVSVVKGEPFLGRDVKQGAVLYLALEEDREEVRDHFRLLGLSADEGQRIHIMAAAVENRAQALDALKMEIQSIEGLVLVVIDPVFDFVGSLDANDYAKVNRAFKPLHLLSRTLGPHIMLVHHAHKNEAAVNIGDSALGSTALTAAVDTFFLLTDDSAGRRVISSRQRSGEPFPKTELIWDKDTGSMSLGVSEEAASRAAAKETAKRIDADIIAFVAMNKGCTQAQIFDPIKGVTGNTNRKKDSLRSLVKDGTLVQSDKGAEGVPYTYSVAQVPAEAAPSCLAPQTAPQAQAAPPQTQTMEMENTMQSQEWKEAEVQAQAEEKAAKRAEWLARKARQDEAAEKKCVELRASMAAERAKKEGAQVSA